MNLPTQCLLHYLPVLLEIHWLFLHLDLHTMGPHRWHRWLFYLYHFQNFLLHSSLKVWIIIKLNHPILLCNPPKTLCSTSGSLRILNSGSLPLLETPNIIFNNSIPRKIIFPILSHFKYLHLCAFNNLVYFPTLAIHSHVHTMRFFSVSP